MQFLYKYATKDNRCNWIVRLLAKFFNEIINRGRIFVAWKTYRIKEYIKILRCYKCHGFGHIAKYCSAPSSLCKICGNADHQRRDCGKAERPICLNCLKVRRKDVSHSVRSASCPEYLRQIEIYKSKIDWT